MKKAAKDPNAKKSLDEVQRKLEEQAKNGDRASIKKLKELEKLRELASKAAYGDQSAISELNKIISDLQA